MAIGTYLELQNAIADFLNRTDLTLSIPNFIVLGEGDIRVDMRSRSVTLDANIIIDGAEIILPADVKVVRSLYDEYGPISLVAPETVARINKRWPSGATRADVAAVLSQDGTDADELILLPAPLPQEEVTATIIYEPDLVALSDDNPSNWLLRKHPNVYLYAALKHSAAYLRDDERVPYWDKLYKDHMSRLERLRDDVEYGAGPLVAMPRRALGSL